MPIFLTISGYLYFRKYDVGGWGAFRLADYWVQNKKRVQSLLIPYFFWIIVLLCANFVYDALKGGSQGIEPYLHIGWRDLYGIFYEGPLYFPFYYIRDLIILSLLAPLICLFLKKSSWVGVAFMIFLYFTVESFFVGLPTKGLLFFSVGALLGIKSCDDVTIPKWCGYLCIGLALVCGVIFMMSPIISLAHYYSGIAFTIVATVCLAFLMQFVNLQSPFALWCKKMGKYSFFLYATHLIHVLGFAKGFEERLLKMLPSPYNDLVGTLTYILFPLVVIAFLIGVYEVWHRLSPSSLRVMVGSRQK